MIDNALKANFLALDKSKWKYLDFGKKERKLKIDGANQDLIDDSSIFYWINGKNSK
jgi:hypothetical protein